MNRSLEAQVYIVTGGSKGFGLAIASGLVAAGARVGLIGRGEQALAEAVAGLGADNAFGVTADVSRVAEVESAFSRIVEHFGRLDGLVNNAGLARPGMVEQLVEAEVLLQLNTNLLGTIFCCRAAIPRLRGGPNPRIVNISSASAWHTDEMYHLSVYAATKAAVERFTRDLRLELQSDAIGVSCVRPGGAWTSFSEGWDPVIFGKAMEAWHDAGPHMDTGMDAGHVADAVVHVLGYPPGVAIDLIEVRPNRPVPKVRF